MNRSVKELEAELALLGEHIKKRNAEEFMTLADFQQRLKALREALVQTRRRLDVRRVPCWCTRAHRLKSKRHSGECLRNRQLTGVSE